MPADPASGSGAASGSGLAPGSGAAVSPGVAAGPGSGSGGAPDPAPGAPAAPPPASRPAPAQQPARTQLAAILLESVQALAAAGEVESACRLAGRAYAALRHEDMPAARRFDVFLHRMIRRLDW